MEVRTQVMAEICHRVLDGLGMPIEWKGDISKCSCNGAMKLPEHGMKEVEMVL